MTKRKHRRPMQTTRDGRVLIIPDRRDIPREQEILAKPANAFAGTIVEQLVSRLHQSDCTAQEAQNIGLALQQILRGDAALLNNMDDPAVAEQVARLKEQAAKEDKANQDWEENQEKFITQVYDKADKITPVGEKKDRVIANGLSQLQQARENARARWALQREEFARHLSTDPKVEVQVEAEFEHTTINGVVSVIEVKPVLKILDRTFVLTPGKQFLPKILADRYLEHQRTVRENQERKKVMEQYMERDQYEAAMRTIDQRYGNRRDGQSHSLVL